MALTAKRKRFTEEFPVDWNGAAAARRAGFSAKTAKQAAYKLLRDPAIALAIVRKLEGHTSRVEVTIERVLEALMLAAFFDPGDLVEWNGRSVTLKDSEELTAAQRSNISGISQTKEGIIVRFVDRQEATRDLGRFLKMFTDKFEATGPGGEPLIPWQAIRALLADEAVNTR